MSCPEATAAGKRQVAGRAEASDRSTSGEFKSAVDLWVDKRVDQRLCSEDKRSKQRMSTLLSMRNDLLSDFGGGDPFFMGRFFPQHLNVESQRGEQGLFLPAPLIIDGKKQCGV